MDYSKTFGVVQWTLILGVLISSAAYLRAPENVAVVIGERVVLECENTDTTATPGASLIWRVTRSSGTEENIVACNTPSNIQDGYELELPIGSACNLIIPSATTSLAGQYRCSSLINESDDAASQVIVLESAPQCPTDPSELANVSDTVMMSCSVSCHGNTNTGPVMTWFDLTGQEVSASNTGSSLSPNYVTLVSASIPTVQSYTCNTSFNSAPQSSGSHPATNTPTYNSTCVTQDIEVQYAPYTDNITITPDGSDELYTGSTLTCNATTFPPVTRHQWMNDSGEIISNSAVLTLDQIGENLEYTCTVWNQLGSNLRSVVVNVTQVPVSPDTTTTTPGQGISSSHNPTGSQSTTISGPTQPSTGSGNTGVIVGAVVGGLVALALIIAFIVCCCVESCPLYDTCRDDKQDKYAEQSSSDNSSGDYPNPTEPRSFSSQEQMVLDSRLIGVSVIHAATSDKEDFNVQYAELQFDPSVANRRFTHTGSHIPYYDEHNNIITSYNEEQTIYSYPKSA